MANEVLNSVFSFFIKLFSWTLDGFLWIAKKFFFLLFDGLLTCISAFFTAIDLSSFVATYALKWTSLPSQMIWFINAICLPQALAVVVAAIGIRMMINLIPAAFTRV